MKKVIITISIICGFIKANAQQDAMLSQYMFNGLFINPAYAGSHPYSTISALHRNQWTKFDGAPKTNVVGFDGSLLKNKVGLGLLLANDKIGVTTQNDFYSNYSYKVKLFKGHLSMGVKAGFSAYSSKVSELRVWDQDDEFSGTRRSKFLPKFGFGTYYYTTRGYLGFSMPTLLAYDSEKDFSLNLNRSTDLRRHYYFTGGYVFDIMPALKMKPSFLLKYVPAAPVEADLNMNFLIHDVLWVGGSYRTKDAFVGILEYQVNKKIRLGYAYDHATTIMNQYSNGTHELMIAIDLVREEIKVKNPRFF